jgi:uncharacterized tellurite resistance protein B-like protein
MMGARSPPGRTESLMSILEFLGLVKPSAGGAASGPGETETVRRIVERLDDLEPDRARFIAAFAFILSRVAHADREISDHETRTMERIVAEHGQLPEEQAMIVVQMAKTQSLLFGGTENFLVTREMNRIASREEKLALLDCLFAVSSADRSISTVEDGVARQIAAELKLEHREFIGVRARYRDRLAVFRDPAEEERP